MIFQGLRWVEDEYERKMPDGDHTHQTTANHAGHQSA
jgi:hypothetical protein